MKFRLEMNNHFRLYSLLIFITSLAGLIVLSQASARDHQSSTDVNIDTLEYPIGYPRLAKNALQQLQSYPSPRYLEGNTLTRLFNWMDPSYFGGLSQKGISRYQAVKRGVEIEKELALNWNYFIVIPNSKQASSEYALKDSANPTLPLIRLANEHPEIPLGVITFWVQMRPNAVGFRHNVPMILNKNLDDKYYIDCSSKGKSWKEINYLFPDSLLRIDGLTQRYYFKNMLRHLQRPIDMVNENGEEPPGIYLDEAIKSDPRMRHLKDSLGIARWDEFMAIEKLRMRQSYTREFMDSLPQMKNARFSFYAVEGGPLDRFKWSIMKKCATPVNGQYYSTPDFYPRTPSNWKTWNGPWHGWAWLDQGRKVEIGDGNNLFSPFVAAGWSRDPRVDIRPAQWLGLLKCAAVIGAEFYYVGYFNIGKPPYTNPAQYAWQAAIPAYAQAITSRYEDLLRNGAPCTNKATGAPIITWPVSENNVLVAVRKSNSGEQYIISGAVMPFSNNIGTVPDKKVIKISLGGDSLTFTVRRQGSVYLYDKTGDSPVFYQLDSWHERTHPDYWNKDFYFEAEVTDDKQRPKVLTDTNGKPGGDFTEAVSYVKVYPGLLLPYVINRMDTTAGDLYVWMYCKGNGQPEVSIQPGQASENTTVNSQTWKWEMIKISARKIGPGDRRTITITSYKGDFFIDKLIISRNKTIPDMTKWR